MKIDSKDNIAYSCQYEIGMSSKFSKTIFLNIPELVFCLEEAGLDLGYAFKAIHVDTYYVLFSTSISPCVNIDTLVSRIKRETTKKLIDKGVEIEKPLFNSSFFCQTLLAEGDVNTYMKSLKQSYRSTKGELL